MLDIRSERKKLGLSQEQLGALCGVTRNAILMIEKGRRRPSVRTAKLLASVFHVEWWKLVDPDDSECNG